MLIRPVHIAHGEEFWAARMVVAGVTMCLVALLCLGSGVYVETLFDGADVWPVLLFVPGAAWFARAGVVQVRGSATLRIDLAQRTLRIVRRHVLVTLRQTYALDDVTVWLGPARDRRALYAQPSVVVRLPREGWVFIHGTFNFRRAQDLAEQIAARWGVALERSEEKVALPLRYTPADFS